MAPHGIGNPAPTFLTRGVTVANVASVGDTHVRFRLKQGNKEIPAVGWNMRKHPLLFKSDCLFDVVYSPELNVFNGISNVQLVVKELFESNG